MLIYSFSYRARNSEIAESVWPTDVLHPLSSAPVLAMQLLTLVLLLSGIQLVLPRRGWAGHVLAQSGGGTLYADTIQDGGFLNLMFVSVHGHYA
jgi:hypothetical protein